MDSILNYERKLEEDYYKILGCNESSTSEQILTEYKLRALNCHPDKNLDDVESVEKFQKLQQAKNILLNEELRREYDKWRRGGICMSFEQWRNLSEAAHMSFHWAFKKQEQPTIESPPVINNDYDDSEIKPVEFEMSPKIRWESDRPNSLLKKFRNYQI